MVEFLRKEDEMTNIYKYEAEHGDIIITLYDTGDYHDFRFKKGYINVCKNEKGENIFVDEMPDNLDVWGDEDYMNELIEKFD